MILHFKLKTKILISALLLASSFTNSSCVTTGSTMYSPARLPPGHQERFDQYNENQNMMRNYRY